MSISLAIRPKKQTPHYESPCSGESYTQADLEALRASGGLVPECHYIVSDYNHNHPDPAGIAEILFHAVSADSLSMEVAVRHTSDPDSPWTGRMDTVEGRLDRLEDNKFNKISGRVNIERFDWVKHEGVVVEGNADLNVKGMGKLTDVTLKSNANVVVGDVDITATDFSSESIIDLTNSKGRIYWCEFSGVSGSRLQGIKDLYMLLARFGDVDFSCSGAKKLTLQRASLDGNAKINCDKTSELSIVGCDVRVGSINSKKSSAVTLRDMGNVSASDINVESSAKVLFSTGNISSTTINMKDNKDVAISAPEFTRRADIAISGTDHSVRLYGLGVKAATYHLDGGKADFTMLWSSFSDGFRFIVPIGAGGSKWNFHASGSGTVNVMPDVNNGNASQNW